MTNMMTNSRLPQPPQPCGMCRYVVIASGCASCPKLRCERPGCSTAFCYHCKQEWHPNQTCDAARAQRASRPATQAGPTLGFPHDEGLQREFCLISLISNP